MSVREMLETVEHIFNVIAQCGVLFMEFIGVVIILWTAVRCVIELIRRDKQVKLDLAQGIALALEFKLGSEVLRTTIVRGWEELGIVGTIVALRCIMTFLIHWEIKNEEAKLL